jgi:hypothetical protein
VIRLTASRAARDVLADVSGDHAETTASFLGHLPDRRGARSIRADLLRALLLDEASMMSASRRTATRSWPPETRKQLAAAEGGGMTLLADLLGHVQLAEAARFTHEWEMRRLAGPAPRRPGSTRRLRRARPDHRQ